MSPVKEILTIVSSKQADYHIRFTEQEIHTCHVSRALQSVKHLIQVMDLEVGHNVEAVVAIDFGTTYSGYAFSLTRHYKKDPLRIYGNSYWAAGSAMSLKCPTCILFDEDKTFNCFGYEAEDKYSDLVSEKKHKDWYFFKRFKMLLHRHEGLNRDTVIEDEEGKGMKAKDVFACGITFLKQHAEETLKKTGYELEEWDIRWVLTVPAIWTNAAKQFMREAAQKADILNDQLIIALEPEAASVYCKHLPDMRGSNIFKPGSKYMVIDLGGGTADITAHEVCNNGSLRELHKASGGAWGGTKVDASFMQLLTEIIGDDVMEDIKTNHTDDYIELKRDFEVKKRKIKENMTAKMHFKIPISLRDRYEKINQKSFADAVKESPYSDNAVVVADKLRLTPELLKGLFMDPLSHLEEHIRKIMAIPCLKTVKTFLLVGSFSESQFVQETLRRKFPNVQVIVPIDSGLAVLKGAVLFGHKPLSICSRIAKYTYGVAIGKPFIEGRHPQQLRKVTANGVICTDVFHKYVEIGDSIEIGDVHTMPFTAGSGCRSRVRVYQSTEPDPLYVTDDSCSILGEVILTLDASFSRNIEVSMTFGGTEISVEASDKEGGGIFKAKYDFLSN